MLFRQSIDLGLASLGHWQVLLALAGYTLFSVAAALAPMFLEMEEWSPFADALLRGLAACGLVAAAMPTIMGEAASGVSTASRLFLMAIGAVLIALAAAQIAGWSRLARWAMKETALVTFAAGLLAIRLLAVAYAVELDPEAAAAVYPGWLVTLGYLIVGDAAARLAALAAMGVNYLIRGQMSLDSGGAAVPIATLAVVTLCHALPLLAYIAYVRVAIRAVGGG